MDIYSRFDAVGIACEDRENSLDCTVAEALAFKNTFKVGGHFYFNCCDQVEDRVVSVRDTDTLWKAITVLVERNVHRLCAVNEQGAIEVRPVSFFPFSHIQGVISLSDVINHMVVEPGENLKVNLPRKKHYNHHMGGDISNKDLDRLLLESAQKLEEEAHLITH